MTPLPQDAGEQHVSVLDELEHLQRLTFRRAPLRKRQLVMDRILEAHAMAIQEAFMVGRIYAARGEKESPAEIQARLRDNVARVERAAILQHRARNA